MQIHCDIYGASYIRDKMEPLFTVIVLHRSSLCVLAVSLA